MSDDKGILFVSKDTRQRVNIIKAQEGYKTQDEVVNAALDALEALQEANGEPLSVSSSCGPHLRDSEWEANDGTT